MINLKTTDGQWIWLIVANISSIEATVDGCLIVMTNGGFYQTGYNADLVARMIKDSHKESAQ